MSVAPKPLCTFRVTVCARETCGMAMVATPATAAPPRNLRRVDVEDSLSLAIYFTLPWDVSTLTIYCRVLFHDPDFLIRIRQPLGHNRTGCSDRTQHWAGVGTPSICPFYAQTRTKWIE